VVSIRSSVVGRMRHLLVVLDKRLFELTSDEVYYFARTKYGASKVVAHLTKGYMAIMFVTTLIVGFCCQSLYYQDGSAAIANAFVLSWVPIFLLSIILGAAYPHLRRLQVPTIQRGAMIGISTVAGLALGYQRFEPGTFFFYVIPFFAVPLIIGGAAVVTRSVLGRR